MKDRASEPPMLKSEDEEIHKPKEETQLQKPVQETRKVSKPEERKIQKPAEEVKRLHRPTEEVRKVPKPEEKILQKPADEVKRVQKSEEVRKVQKLEIQKSEEEEKQSQKTRQPSPQTATKIPAPSTIPSRGSGSPSTPRQSKEKVPEKEVRSLSIEKPEKLKSPKKGPPPVKKHIIQNTPNASEQFLSERQTTHTILTVQQHKELGIDPKELGVPTVLDSPKAKPKSVVRPMPKNPSLASALPVTSILPQGKARQETVIPSSLRGRPNSAKVGQESGTSSPLKLTKPRSAVSRTPASTTVKPPTSERPKRATVESKIPKVRA